MAIVAYLVLLLAVELTVLGLIGWVAASFVVIIGLIAFIALIGAMIHLPRRLAEAERPIRLHEERR